MLVNITADFPKEIDAAARSDMRATFRAAIENTLRSRMDTLVDKLKKDARYQSIAPDYRVEQSSQADQIAFAVVNDNPHAGLLIGGTRPHVIEQRAHMVPLDALLRWSGGDLRAARVAQARIAVRGVTIHHPGTQPDQPVLDAIAQAEPEMVEAAGAAADRWVATYGTDVSAEVTR